MDPLFAELNKLSQVPSGELPEAAKQRQARIEELQKQINAINDDPAMRTARETVMKYQPPHSYTGHVCLFLRQPPTAVQNKQ
jgi:hypothetical protein